jgi:dienelactone hydrolase
MSETLLPAPAQLWQLRREGPRQSREGREARPGPRGPRCGTRPQQYPDAGHSFLNDLSLAPAGDHAIVPSIIAVMGRFAGPSGYDEPSATDARQRIASFFDRHLQRSTETGTRVSAPRSC